MGEERGGDHKHFCQPQLSVYKKLSRKRLQEKLESCVVPMTMAEGTIIPEGKKKRKKRVTLQRTE